MDHLKSNLLYKSSLLHSKRLLTFIDMIYMGLHLAFFSLVSTISFGDFQSQLEGNNQSPSTVNTYNYKSQ